MDRFEQLFEEHAEPLLGFLFYRTGNRALSEDLVAETFERVLRARRRFDPRRGSEKTWVYSIALNCLRDHARKTAAEARAIERAVPVAAGESTGGVERVDDRDQIARGLDGLSDEEREVIALRYGADLSVPEISKLTGLKLTTVEGRVYSALRKLRDRLN